MSETSGLLSSIRVIDMAGVRAEMAGRLLADLGAEVIKVEPPEGAEARRIAPFDNAESLYWAAVGAGKQSVVLDIESPAGANSLRELIASADVFIESGDPGYLSVRGLGYLDLATANPALVYVSVTPYGQDGPDALSPATELTIEAAGGLLGMQGDGDRPPIPVGFPQPAFHAGAQAAADTIFALHERSSSGRGQHLDVSMQACVVWTLMNATGYPPNHHADPPGFGATRNAPPQQLVPGVTTPALWECKDGYVTCTFALGVLGGRTFDRLIRWRAEEGALPAELEGISWEQWTYDCLEGRIPVESAILGVEEVRRFLLTKTKRELMDRAVPENMLVAPIYTTADLTTDPQLADRDYWVDVAGRRHPGPFAKLSRTPLQIRPAPALGGATGKVDTSRRPDVPAPRVTGAARGRAFDGLKIADFAWVGVGPIISKSFADHGATVVHMESISRPDVLRTIPPWKDAEPGLDRAQFFANFNSSKLGLSVNLSTPEGRGLAQRVVDWADVIVESFTPGTLSKLGFGYEQLSQARPDLIMLSTCLRGQTGPERSYAGFGGQGAALSGLYSITGWPDRPPKGPWGAFTDFITPRFGVSVLGAAVLERQRTGLGQHIDLSQIEASIHFLEPDVLDYTVNGTVRQPLGHESLRAAPHGVYAVEGVERYIALAVETPAQWHGLRSVAPLEAFASTDFDSLDARLRGDSAIDATLAAWLADKDPHKIVETLKAAGVPAALVQRPTDLYEDAQLTHRGFFVTCDHAVMGPTPYDGPATRFSATPPKLSAAPTLGQHTGYVLRELLGLDDDELVALAAADALT